MKKLHLLTSILISSMLYGCTSHVQSNTQMATNFIQRQQVTSTTQENFSPKNPNTVALYTKEKEPHTAYRVIGVAKVSKYNMLGMQRQEATLHEMVRNLAASIGGDGVININQTHDGLEANVIKFQKILI